VSKAVLEKLQSKFGAAIQEVHSHLGDDTAIVDPNSWKTICEFLKNDASCDFDLFIDLTAVDYPDRTPRLEVVLHMYSVGRRHRIRLKTRIGTDSLENTEIDSVTSVWAGANWFERETYDMFGITFRGHPDLRRILLYPEFVGHPLLKDYDAQKTQPLVPYRTEADAGMILEKVAPFGTDEGMSFGRKFLPEKES
jgi:NADH-quinone oxidoreductase subunit C